MSKIVFPPVPVSPCEENLRLLHWYCRVSKANLVEITGLSKHAIYKLLSAYNIRGKVMPWDLVEECYIDWHMSLEEVGFVSGRGKNTIVIHLGSKIRSTGTGQYNPKTIAARKKYKHRIRSRIDKAVEWKADIRACIKFYDFNIHKYTWLDDHYEYFREHRIS